MILYLVLIDVHVFDFRPPTITLQSRAGKATAPSLPTRVMNQFDYPGHRLRAAGVSFEDRQDLPGHKSDRMTTHYSAPDIARLIEAAEKVCVRRPNAVLQIAPHANWTVVGNGVGRIANNTLKYKCENGRAPIAFAVPCTTVQHSVTQFSHSA